MEVPMRFDRIALNSAILAAAMLSAAAARADNSALGLWVGHTGRGAVEITDCGGKLCGYVAWVKDAENASECGKQIIGNVAPVGTNKWDNGWIYDPDRGKKYDVEVTALDGGKLRVKGYAGTKWLSETYTWKRAPADMQKCSGGSATKATPAPAAAEPPREAAKAEAAKPAPQSDAVELEAAGPDNDKADTAKAAPAKDAPAKADEPQPRDTAKAEPEDEGNDAGSGPDGKEVIAGILKELESGDGPVKLKRNGKTCKVTAPFVGVVTFPCDGDKD
jgi:uncharacterized protein (DUF2147 family)